ncbi:MAG: IS21 family transposase [bacterium]|nr:IS21 family transposase [bacterium]
MGRKGLSMRNVREILRLKMGMGLKARQVARSCKVSHSTVLDYEKRIKEAGLSWPLPEDMDDIALERIVCGNKSPKPLKRNMPKISYLAQEMRRKHVTLFLLWQEYIESYPAGYQYSQFCQLYSDGKKKLDLTMRQGEHKAGEKVFTDYAGDTFSVVDPHTGEIEEAYLFVAVMGASSHIYAEAVPDMKGPGWLSSHINAFEYFGGVPEIIVPDNTKCAVIKPDRYEPDLNLAFVDMAAHYDTVIIPARVRKPRDKAKVEVSVQIAERWIMAALRNRTFFSITEINEAVWELLEVIKHRRFKQMNTTRWELFQKLDKPALRPLPNQRYQFLEWAKAKVHIDYHIAVNKHFYSVPHQLVGEQVDVRLSSTIVEVLYKNKRVASHLRSYLEGKTTTVIDHLPRTHQEYMKWTPERIISWAAETGPNTVAMVKKIMDSRPHPALGFKSCLGILSLSRKYPVERLEAACRRGLKINVTTYKSIKSILERGLDQIPLKEDAVQLTLSQHENIRGKEYYGGGK